MLSISSEENLADDGFGPEKTFQAAAMMDISMGTASSGSPRANDHFLALGERSFESLRAIKGLCHPVFFVPSAVRGCTSLAIGAKGLANNAHQRAPSFRPFGCLVGVRAAQASQKA